MWRLPDVRLDMVSKSGRGMGFGRRWRDRRNGAALLLLTRWVSYSSSCLLHLLFLVCGVVEVVTALALLESEVFDVTMGDNTGTLHLLTVCVCTKWCHSWGGGSRLRLCR